MTNADRVPITVALQNLSGAQVVEWNVQMAGASLAALPTLVVYIVLGRYFIRGLLAEVSKGRRVTPRLAFKMPLTRNATILRMSASGSGSSSGKLDRAFA